MDIPVNLGDDMRKYLKASELKALLQVPKRPRDKLLLKLLYETGMRVGELVALTIADVDLEAGEITIQRAKRHKEGRVVPVVDEWTICMLYEYIGQRKIGPLFLSNFKTGLTRRQVERLMTNYSMQVGIPKDLGHPHTLRHTHAVDSLNFGIDLRTLRDNLGHSTLRTTQIYLESSTDLEEREEKYRTLFGHPLEPEQPALEPKSSFDTSFLTSI
jgi:integrase/recombinase XerC/integrase/recombinase XerD